MIRWKSRGVTSGRADSWMITWSFSMCGSMFATDSCRVRPAGTYVIGVLIA